MSVRNGEDVEAELVNGRFVSKTDDSEMAGKLSIKNETNAGDPTGGAFHTKGGAGIEKDLCVGGDGIFAGLLQSEASKAENIETSNLLIKKMMEFEHEINADLTGADAVLEPGASVVILTNASLVSIAGISTATKSRVLFLINKIGDKFSLQPGIGAVGEQIATPEDEPVSVPADGVAMMIFSPQDNKWRAMSGSGDSSGGGLEVSDLAQRNLIPPEARREGLKVFVVDIKTNFQLQGGIENTNWARLPNANRNQKLVNEASYTIQELDDLILIDASFEDIEIVFPAATGVFRGKEVKLKRLDQTDYVVTLTGLIDGVSSDTLPYQHTPLTVIGQLNSEWGKY